MKISTSTIARKNNITAKDLFDYLLKNNYLNKEGGKYKLTAKGFHFGGDYCLDVREGKKITFVIWDENNFNKIINELAPHIVNTTFRYPMKFLSIRTKFGEKISDDVWKSLNNGTAVLQTVEQLNQYLHSYGRMHHAKMHSALVELLRDNRSIDKEDYIEIIDYGCGQGLASITLLNILDEANISIVNIKKITLIEPGSIALDRAVSLLKKSTVIVSINKDLDSITSEDLMMTDDNTIKIHLLSNILDMGEEYFDVKILADKIRSTQTGDNYFVCVSPQNEGKLHDFTEEIVQTEIKSLTDEIFEDLTDKPTSKDKVSFSPETILDTIKFISKDRSDIDNPSDHCKPWNRIHMIFKKEF